MKQYSLYTIIVTYNGSEWIERCIKSVTSESKVIVIDNGSTDNTVQLIKAHYSEVELIENSSNLGFGQANNLGMARAISEGATHVFLLNQDAWIIRGSLTKLADQMADDPSVGILSPIHFSGDEKNLDFMFVRYIAPNRCPELLGDLAYGELKDRVYYTDFVNAAGWLIPTEVLKKVGGFNPVFFHYGEDHELTSRMEANKFNIGISTQVAIVHDRPQRRNANNKWFSSQGKIKRSALIELTDSTSPLEKNYHRIRGKLLRRAGGSVVKLRWSIAWNYLETMLYLRQAKRICRNNPPPKFD